MRETIRIASRFQGPPRSSNGGYAAGVVAGPLGNAAEVTLRKPPPLDCPLVLEWDGQRSHLWDGETLIAEARRAEPELDIPPPPTLAEAEAARPHGVKMDGHLLPRCFVCGPKRDEDDGLRIFPGPLERDDGLYGASWRPTASLADEAGIIRPQFFWSALDCPGAHALFPDNLKPLLLGRLTARIEGRVRHGDRCMVTAWRIGEEGRKIFAGSAVYSELSELLAWAYATWFKVDSFQG